MGGNDKFSLCSKKQTTNKNNKKQQQQKSKVVDDICRDERVSRVSEGNIRIRRRSLSRFGGVTIGGVTFGGVTSGGVTSGFRKRRRCTEAASVTPSPLVFRPTRNQDSRRRRRRCRQITLFFYFAVANVMYEKLIVSELSLIISIYIHSTYE